MKKGLLILLLLASVFPAMANHTKGGWLYYRYLGPGITNPNAARYEITLKIYTQCFLTTSQFCPSINISIFDAGSNSLVQSVTVPYNDSINIQNCTLQQCHPCVSPIPDICYKITTYQFQKELLITTDGYVVSYQRCCRVAGIVNMAAPSSAVGDTWTVNIPGSAGLASAPRNSSALFPQNDTAMICKDNFFSYSFGAYDPDNDSLSYEFTDAYTGPDAGSGGAGCGNGVNPPPYPSINYVSPYSGSQPMGPGVTIDPVSGLVSGIAPSVPGIYVLTVTAHEWVRGTSIHKASVRKSLHIQVADCSLTQAQLYPEYQSCHSFTMSFINNASGGNIQTYYWDFGDPASGPADTSSQYAPLHIYSDTGTFILKLVVNRNLPCSDSTTAPVKVYPYVHPGFSVAGQCKNTPISFTDTTTTTYGVVNYWHWNFGDITAPDNISLAQNPTHVYTSGANYNVEFIVANSKGCRDTVSKTILITDKPALTVTHDTLICIIDTLQLSAIGMGSFAWTPNYMINNVNIPDPLVSPDIPTRYYVTLTDPYGCVGTDSVKVDVRSSVTLQAGNDSTVCQHDEFLLSLTGNALHYLWTPGASLNDSTLKNPLASPLFTTTYQVRGNIGKCVATDDITIHVVPYPAANAGADTTICFGASAQLHASGGTLYNWIPAAFLNATNIPNPISIRPVSGVRYIVTVRDTAGCPKAVKDTVFLSVTKIIADAGPRDTVVVIDQPLFLHATGGINYLWTPSEWLSSIGIANPVALPQNDIEYVVMASNAAGCFGYDSIRVKLFKVEAGFYVPDAFTPNGDGINDIFRPILLGMKSLDVFRVSNRFGQLLYSGTDMRNGWDGRFGGREQDAGTYIWYCEGTDYKNNKIKKKGHVILLR